MVSTRVVDEEYLPVTPQLTLDPVANHALFVGGYVRAHRKPALGRRQDHAQVANSKQGHLQGARNRGRRHRQHIDRSAQLLDALFVFDAETLLLVDHEEAQVFERNVLTEQSVRADYNIDFSLGDIAQHRT